MCVEKSPFCLCIETRRYMREEMEMLTVALRGLTVLPNMIVHLDISRNSSMEAANQAMEGDQHLFFGLTKR